MRSEKILNKYSGKMKLQLIVYLKNIGEDRKDEREMCFWKM